MSAVPGRIRSAVGAALEAASRLARAIGRDLAPALEAVGKAWLGLDVRLRRGLAAGVATIAVVALLVAVAVPALPCQFPGGDACAPPDDAAKLVPADALAYVHVDVEPSSSQYRLASDDLSRIPTISSQVLGRLLGNVPGSAGSTSRFARSIVPWLGSEAALALLPSGRAPQEVELLAVGSSAGAQRYQRGFEGAAAQTVTYRGVDIVVGRRGVASAIVHGFLAIGTPTTIRAVVATATGAAGAPALAGAPSASAARGLLPAQRVADAYLSPRGIATLVARPRSPLAPLAPFVAPGASRGVAAALVAADGNFELEVRSDLDPKLARSHPGFFAAFPRFQPTLVDQLPAATLAYLGIGEPGEAIASLLGQASRQAPGLARAATAVIRRLGAVGKLNLRSDLPPVLGSEGALALEETPAGNPGGRGQGQVSVPGLGRSAPSANGGGAPYLLYLGGGIDREATRTALARLELPFAKALAPGGTGGFQTGHVGRTATRSLPGTPFGTFTYAFVDGRLVVATDPAGVGAVAGHGASLSSSDAYRAATAGFPSSSSLVAYLDLGGLVALAERAGLAANPAYATFAPDIHRLSALGVSVASSPTSLATDARLVLGPAN